VSKIQIEHQPSAEKLQSMGINAWPVWSKEVSRFPWTYDARETCYFLDGKVIVTTEEGESVQMGKGDLVVFPAGMNCSWEILEDVHKHYQFD